MQSTEENVDIDIMETPFHTVFLTQEAATNLKVGHYVDHRNPNGKFMLAIIDHIEGTNVTVHYIGRSQDHDVWCDITWGLDLFAHPRSISQRSAHRLTTLSVGHFVAVNPKPHEGWKQGLIGRKDCHSGQVEVEYQSGTQIYRYWVHLDNTLEVRRLFEMERFKEIEGNHESIGIVPEPEIDYNLSIPSAPSLIDLIDEQSESEVEGDGRIGLEQNEQIPFTHRPRANGRSSVNLQNMTTNPAPSLIDLLNEDIHDDNDMENEQIPEDSFVPLMWWKDSINSLQKEEEEDEEEIDSIKSTTIKRLHEELERKTRTIQLMRDQMEDCKSTVDAVYEALSAANQQIENVTERNTELQNTVDLWSAKSSKIQSLDLDALNALHTTILGHVKAVEKVKDRLMENMYQCIICIEKRKNVSFDGCAHMALCDECESKMEEKECPICKTPYVEIKKIVF